MPQTGTGRVGGGSFPHEARSRISRVNMILLNNYSIDLQCFQGTVHSTVGTLKNFASNLL